MELPLQTAPAFPLGRRPLAVEDVVALARGDLQVVLDNGSAALERTRSGARHLAERLERGGRVYGVTTGFGESCLNPIDPDFLRDLPVNLMRYHGCGTGAPLTDEQSAAVLAVRLASLAAGWSAVRPVVLERLADLLNHRILPVIPSEGSVGASGDLTPLSYVAAVLLGEREVSYQGRCIDAARALAEAGLEPVRFAPKESLAIMNGTSVMTALVCLAFERSRLLARWTAALTATLTDVLQSDPGHFDDRLFEAKPHPGQRAFARWVREDLGPFRGGSHEGRIQARYSVRCAPHVVGVLLDSLPWMRAWIETEVNGANDNPLVDPRTGDVLHGGNFYGGHMCFVADGLKNLAANIADLLDRNVVLLCSPASSNGLPENLVGRQGPDRLAHHGFKAMEIAASALAAEAQKLALPASVFSRSTEGHNQDKVSMGTIAARDALRALDLAETVAAIATLAACQAVDLRRGEGCHHRSLALRDAVRRRVPFNDKDRRQDGDVAAVLDMMRQGELPCGEVDFG